MQYLTPADYPERFRDGARRYSWLWDFPYGNDRFDAALRGEGTGSYNEDWAMARLIDYAPYREMMRRLPKKRFVEIWPRISRLIRPHEIKEGINFYHQKLLREGVANDS